MVLMVIEAHAGGRLLGRTHGDQQLQFQRLLELADRHHLASAAEERVACGSDPVGQPQFVRQALGLPGPSLPETGHLLGRADIDIFAHAERLQAIEMPGRLPPEAVAGHVEAQPAARDRAAARRQRIHGVAGGRGENQIGRGERGRPIAARLMAVGGSADFCFGSVQRADAAEQVGKALQIARLLQLVAAHDRGKPQHFRGGLAVARDKSRQALDHLFVERSTSVDAVDAHRPEQRRGERFERIARLRGGFPRRVADVHAARPALRS